MSFFFVFCLVFEVAQYYHIFQKYLLHRPAMPFGNRKKYFRGSHLVQYCLSSKNTPLWKPEINNLGIFQSLKLRNSIVKILQISLELNFTPNTSNCYGLIDLLLQKLFAIKSDFMVYFSELTMFWLVVRKTFSTVLQIIGAMKTSYSFLDLSPLI